MSNEPLKLAVIISSVREGRFGPVPGQWFAEQARERADLLVDVIDLTEHELPSALSHNPSPETAEALATISPRLEQADAFVVVTPEYNHSFPASLKHVIDWHYTQWRAKPVGFVSYGGLAGGLRAVEQLRPIFAELHAVTVRDCVSFHSAWEQFGEDGLPKDPEGPQGAAKVLLDQLIWWAAALREGREKNPYQA
ncbi:MULTISPECIES: NADPH-dependent FMN reductase [Streptomyces]|uniref:NADPH-dependent FMN reductase n=1 Tax=Streptomyces TaxID=1883 RepID=UPI000F710922|nr:MULTISPECIES: NAD(P)H-dependent oxidoreductase [unclassified Streptomyces]AZM94090.1 NADPH-dependent oxidoreductase [Streptomyces sp. W1SF4]RSS56012.1 NADPH-dependent oxidoreductase [Streptomyces sp. WAC07061]